MVDDKLRILAAMKKVWGWCLTTAFPRQGHYALDPGNGAAYPPADISIARIGEHAPMVRARICDEVAFLGINFEEKCNVTNAGVISAETSRVTVRVIHTDEEVVIAKSVYRVLRLSIEKENEHAHDDKNA